ncbi:MAG: acylneuraminate cytidylyltransferase family protein [Kiloniellaceae bacterium]
MTTLAVIPARGGSKAIPRKNIRPLGGKPLIAWSIAAALAARLVDRVLVSTDDEEIANASRAAGAEVPFLRPAELAGDEVHSVYSVLHALDWLEEHEGTPPGVVTMLLPTSPLRAARDVDQAVEMLANSGAASVISVCAAGSPLGSLRWMRKGRLKPLTEDSNRNFQRQDVEQLYAVNGSIYVAASSVLREHRSFHISGAAGSVMSKLRSIDINTLDDFAMAEALVPLGERETLE